MTPTADKYIFIFRNTNKILIKHPDNKFQYHYQSHNEFRRMEIESIISDRQHYKILDPS